MNFAIWVTSGCNMNCKYCYVDGKKGTSFFSKENVENLVKFIKVVSEKEKKIKISFFGGEPLLNLNLIQMIIEHCNKELAVKVEYYITTNGLLINEQVAKFFLDNKIFVSLSWDGCKEANDLNRVDKSGRETYQRIRKAYHLLKKYGLNNVRVRATFNCESIKYLRESIKFFIKEDQDISVMFVPDYFDKNWSEEKIIELHDVLRCLEKNDLGNISIISDNMTKGVCGGGVSNFNIYVDGFIYPCSFVVNEEQFCIGDIWNGLNKKRIDALVANYNKPILECDGCDYADYCLSHKCRYLNWALESEINKPSPLVCHLENLKWCSNKKYL